MMNSLVEQVDFLSQLEDCSQEGLDILTRWHTEQGDYAFDLSKVKEEDMYELYTLLFVLKNKLRFKIDSLKLMSEFSRNIRLVK